MPSPRTDKPRERAARILRTIEEGRFADELLEQARREFDARDSAFITELVYGALRNRLRIDWTLNQFSKTPIAKADAWTRNILRMGAYQLLFLDRVPVSAAVNTSVDLAKHHGKVHSYVNGLLRNLDRNRASLRQPEKQLTRLSILYSHPEWLVKRWLARLGPGAAEAILINNNRPAPLSIRVNTLMTTREELRASVESEGAHVSDLKYSPVGLEIRSSPGLQSLSAFQKGLFIVQDEAAQLIAPLLAPEPGEVVLDACAAPGGKATHLAELMKNSGAIVALENDPARIERIRENCLRLGITIIKPAHGDAATFREGPFDKVLIDAPCSGLGVLRRHPDGRWTKTEKTIRDRAVMQRRILENCASLVKPGGALVYATCTTEPEENEQVIDAFLAGPGGGFVIDDPRNCLPPPAAALVDERGFFHSYPTEPGMDGFFGVRLILRKFA